jgi:hypothetical protein
MISCSTSHRIYHFGHLGNYKNFCLKEKGIKEIKIEKEKEISPLGWAESGPNPPSPSLSRALALLPCPRSSEAHPPRASRSRYALLSLAVSPAPPVSRARPFSLTTALSLAGGPRSLALSLSPVIGCRHDHRWPPVRHISSPLLAHQPNWRLAPVPSHPVTTVCPSYPVATTVRHHRRRSKPH